VFTDRELDIIKLEIQEKHRELLMQFAKDKMGNRYASNRVGGEDAEVHPPAGSEGGPWGNRPEIAAI
jgi:hypothetical protein